MLETQYLLCNTENTISHSEQERIDFDFFMLLLFRFFQRNYVVAPVHSEFQ